MMLASSGSGLYLRAKVSDRYVEDLCRFQRGNKKSHDSSPRSIIGSHDNSDSIKGDNRQASEIRSQLELGYVSGHSD